MKIAFVFPGQGSQKPGMGRDFYGSYPSARKVFEEADAVLGFPLSNAIFEGSEEDLKKTSITQVAILAVEIAILRVMGESGLEPSLVAGHSLGEYSALVAAGAMDFCDAVTLVQKRAGFMEEAGLKNPSGMLAIIGLNKEEIEKVCSDAAKFGVVDVANFNSPGQIVISGEMEALRKAEESAKVRGAKKCVFLQVGGAFHSRLMDEASKKLGDEIKNVKINPPRISFLANFTGDYLRDPEQIRESLVKQVNNPVRWTGTMQKILDEGVEAVIEVGPGRVLSGLWRRFDRTKKVLNVEDRETLSFAIETSGSPIETSGSPNQELKSV